jgi:flavin-dependent dehydrogenase
LHDVVVVGGGPAGSVCAARLAAAGRSVLVLERDRHPRFHVGESLLPCSLGVLEAIGVLDEVSDRFLVKRGARFVDGADESRTRRYSFDDAFHSRWTHAFQVPRDEFDQMLFRRAGACGADVREGWTVTRVVREAERAVGVQARDPEGGEHAFDARFVIDASGRDALMARATGSRSRIAGLDQTALFTQVRGAWRDEGEREGDLQLVVANDGQGGLLWLWLIPFNDGRTSSGASVSSAWVKAHRDAGGPAALLDAAIAQAPAAARMLAGSERLFEPEAAADFSFRVKTVRGDGWLAVGDAAGFIDPLFSTGVHLGLHSGLRAADAVHEALAADDVRAERFEGWERELRGGMDLFLGAVQGFYAGDLVSYLFADPQHPFLRRAITSLLAGDVFDPGARWIGELRGRFGVKE